MNISLLITSSHLSIFICYRNKFLKSKRCKILIIIGILLTIAVIALMATTYAIGIMAATAGT
jgi:hypothetical protein